MTRIAKWFGGVAVAVLFAAVCLAACSQPPPPQQFTLRIGVYPTQDNLPYFVMQEQSFAKKHGLRFEETSYPGGAAIIDGMAVGSVDVGYVGSVPVLTAVERGLIPGRAIVVAANNFADPAHPGAAVLADRSVKSWTDLEGKQIAVNTINSLNGAAFKARLDLEGVRGYTMVEIPFANMGLAVVGGNVAAAVMSEPFLTQSLLRGDGKLLGWVIGGPPFERMEFTLIAFRAELRKANPEGVKRFLRAHLQAVGWLIQYQEAARSILVKRLELTPEVGEKIKLLQWPVDARNDGPLLESMQLQLVKTGVLRAQIPASKIYDETLLNEVLAEKR